MASLGMEYIAAGANRHPAAADWCRHFLAFGADQNIAIWCPQVSSNVYSDDDAFLLPSQVPGICPGQAVPRAN